MKITLVAPASEASRRRGDIPLGTSYFHYYKLGVATIAGATPEGFDVEAIDEFVDSWNPETHETDAVAISVMTALAPRAYAVAEVFRKRNIPVILGGMHVTFLPEEALEHADAVVTGPGELAWAEVCGDLRDGRLKKRYDAPKGGSWISVPPARRDIFTNPFYPQLDMVQFTRGCVHRCRFCSINVFSGGQYQKRKIEEVESEYPDLTRRHLMVADDNLYGDREYCLKALKSLAPLKRYLGVQATVDMAFDEEVMDAAQEAKTGAVFVGLESVIGDSLSETGKTHNPIDRYAEAVASFHRHGIFVEGGLMFGFDHDDPGVFERTLKFIEDIDLDVAQIAVVTPMPGTALHKRMETEGRIFDADWSHYDCNNVVFTPKLMSVEELEQGLAWFRQKYYSRRAIAKRSLSAFKNFDLVTWATQTALNLGFRKNHLLGLDYPP